MSLIVCGGATLKCSFGVAPSSFTVLPINRVKTTMPIANIMDYVPFVNIMPFVMCTSLANPTVAAATSAALGIDTDALHTFPKRPMGPWFTQSSHRQYASSQ